MTLFSALPQAIPTGIPTIGFMAQIINTSNSVDSSPMIVSMTPSDDEDDADDHHLFLTPSSVPSTIPSPSTNETTTGVVHSDTTIIINPNENDSLLNDDVSYAIRPLTKTPSHSTLNTPPSQTYDNISAASSETALSQPLLSSQNQIVPNGFSLNHDERISTSSSSTTSTNTSNSLVPNCQSYMPLYLTDMLISAFIITPFVNIHWRGAWDLLDIHFLPDYPCFSALSSLGIGLSMLYTLYLAQGYIQRFYERHRQDLMGLIMTRLYTLILALAYINQWRGLWNLLDLTSNVWYHLLGETVICITFLLVTKSVFNLNSAPFIIGIDTESYFLLDSKHTVSTNHFCQYTFDFFYYEIVEAPLLIIAWRGLYNLSDNYIFPDTRKLSMFVSLASGYLLFFVLSLIQIPIVRCLMNIRRPFIKGLISNIFHLIAFVSVVQIWRSLWIICEQYLNIPERHDLTLWLCYGVAFVVLTCGMAACSLNGPGGSKDSYVNEGPALFFQFDYFSSLLKFRTTNYTKDNKSGSLSSDVSSTETIITNERPYRFEPP